MKGSKFVGYLKRNEIIATVFFALTFIGCDGGSVNEIDRFGNSKFGNNYNRTSLSVEELSRGKVVPKFLSNTTKYQPLYVNFKEEKKLSAKFPIFKNRKILFYTQVLSRDNNFISIRAIDFDTYELMYEKKLKSSVGRSTGLLSMRHGKLYFLTKIGSHKKVEVGKNTYFYGTHYVNSIDLNGENYQKIKLDLNEINNTQNDLKYKFNPSNYLARCKTALNGDFETARPYIIFGCSNGEQYSQFKNLRGSLIRFYLDSDGSIDKKSRQVFFPSGNSDNESEAKDSGIYLAGGLPTIVEDSIFLSTGNGSINRVTDNYGCSILRIDSRNLSIKDKYSSGGDNTFECYFYNLDFSASGIAYISDDTNQYLAMRGKDGVLRLFNKKNLSINSKTRMSNQSYGSPVFFKRGRRIFLAVSSFSTKLVSQADKSYVFGKQEHETFLRSNGYEKKECLGYLPSMHIENQFSQYLYSGDFRDQLLLVNEGSDLFPKILDWKTDAFEGLFPYTLGGKYWANYQKTGVRLNRVVNYDKKIFNKVNIDFYIDRFFIKNNLMNRKNKIMKYGPISYLTKKKDNCLATEEGYTKIFTYSKKPIENQFETDAIYTFEVSKNYKLKLYQIHNLEKNESLDRSNIAVFKTNNNLNIVSYSSSQYVDGKIENKINFLNLHNNEFIKSFKIEGKQHFSMILNIDKKILIPTKKGLNIIDFKI